MRRRKVIACGIAAAILVVVILVEWLVDDIEETEMETEETHTHPKQGQPRKYATTLRCSLCGINWPPYEDFDPCPACEGKVDNIPNDIPHMSYEDARSLANEHEFERYYEETRGTADGIV